MKTLSLYMYIQSFTLADKRLVINFALPSVMIKFAYFVGVPVMIKFAYFVGVL